MMVFAGEKGDVQMLPPGGPYATSYEPQAYNYDTNVTFSLLSDKWMILILS